MQATTQPLASIFTGHRILEVPFYQRSYVWKEEQWERFLEDMEFVTHCKQDYFLGSVILKQQQTDLGESNDFRTIIDGQQRFTTLAIFSKVLCNKTDDLDTFNQHFSVRNKKKGTRSFAINHSINDRKDFEMALSSNEDEPFEDASSRILECYNYFQEHIDPNKLDIDTLLSHLIFIAIELQQQDDEQVIFDTINSLGVRLTTAELLKNYFFTEGSKEEYEELWKPIFEDDKDTIKYWDSLVTLGRLKRRNIDAFFAAFLNIKIHDPKIGVDSEHKMMYRRADAIFNSYKNLISTYNLDKKDFFWEIVQYAEVYRKHFNPNISREELPGKPCIERINFLINVLDSSTMVPYVLYVLFNVRSEKERNDIFGYLESYIVRRQLCNSDNKSYSDLFSESLIGNKILSLEALKDYIENRGEERALSLPTDKRVRACLHEVEHPNKRALAILYLMEGRMRSGKPHATKLYACDEYSLEHLMPKKFEKNWPLIDGYDADQRKSMINTLGNMSILPSRLNSSISNADWATKKAGTKGQNGLQFFASDLVTLKDVIEKQTWNEETIIERADWLAGTVAKIWPTYLPGQEDEDFDFDAQEETEPTGVSEENPVTSQEQKKEGRNSRHDNTKYSLNGSLAMSKSEFVATLVRTYVEQHPEKTYTELKKKFSDKLCAKGYKFLGFLCTKEEYNKWDNKKYKEKRYKTFKEGKGLVSADGITFYVNTQWTQDAMKKIVKLAKDEGMEVSTNNKL